ncbi:MAG: hypothetical protein ACJA0Q_001887 [Saprospiraceae bacterium]|jgi:hypothetical protein
MFKKLKTVGAMVACVAIMSSCTTVVHTAVLTNNPVGTKTGKSESKPFSKSQGVSWKAAMKDGGISKMGVGEFKAKMIFIFLKQTLIVTGE